MNKIALTSFILLLYCVSFGQVVHDTVHYMPLKNYLKDNKKPLTKEDSLKITYIGNDTLIRIDNYKRPKGVSVPYEYKDSIFLNYYIKTAFRIKNDSTDRKSTMKYWKDDIRIFFGDGITKRNRKNFMSFAKNIGSQIDSLNIYEVNSLEKSNYVIYSATDYEYEQKLRKSKTSDFYLYWNKRNQITKCSIKINTETFFNDSLVQSELKKYFVQTLGYFTLLSDFSCESYFSNCYSPEKKLTPLDIELLRYHYSYGICKGTTLETFEENHRHAKEVLKKSNQKMYFFHPSE
ncbi:MAG: hypothetical protein KDD08_04785 [Mangrovimonas sp.]|nr:hypothetical protein [Mangrovimonas sp.]